MNIARLIPLLLLLAACSQTDRWAFDRIESGDAQFDSTKLTYYCTDPVNGIDLELMRTPDYLRTYLNVHSLPIPASKEDPQSARVQLTIGTDTYQFHAYRHQGGQRLLVPEAIAAHMIAGLKAHQPLHIKVPGYAVTIEAEGFEPHYEKLHHTPFLRNPFHLPF